MLVLSKYCQYFSSLILLCNNLFVCNRNSLFPWLKGEYLSSVSSLPLLTTTGCSGQPEHCALHYPWCALHYACPSCALHSALPPWSAVLCTATLWGVVLYTAPRRIGLCTDTLCHCALHCPFFWALYFFLWSDLLHSVAAFCTILPGLYYALPLFWGDTYNFSLLVLINNNICSERVNASRRT